MASKSKGRCVKTRFDRVILCAGTMTDLIEVLSREIQTTEPGQSIQNTESFTAVSTYPGRLEAAKFTPRWDGVNTADQSGLSFTHVCYIPFDQTVFELDRNTFFIRITKSTKNRLYKIKGIKDYGEQEQYIEVEMSETGFEELEASHG